MEAWISLHPKGRRPGIVELTAYLGAERMAFFTMFSGHLARAYGMSCGPAVYTAESGWTFRFGRNGLYLLEGVTVKDGAFFVQDVRVDGPEALRAAIERADALHADGFAERFAAHAAAKNKRQAESTRRRLARERGELDAMAALIDKERFDRYQWADRLPRGTLARLYARDAAGFRDEELADEVGFALYARCEQGQKERALIETGRLKCHGCGAALPYQSSLMVCACGRQYLFRSYMRSFRKNNMPSGSAAHIFADYLRAWPRAASYAEKMRLIDGLVHEFHINLVTGVKGRFVAVNFLEGTKKQIADLILSLAYDENDGTREQFARNLRRE